MFRKTIRSSNLYRWLTIPGGIFIILSFFPRLGTFPILAFIGLLFLYYILGVVFYENHLDDYLAIDYPNRKIRCYPGDEENLQLSIMQKGILPILNAKLVVKYDIVLESSYKFSEEKMTNTLEVPITLLSFEKKELLLPVLAKRRGVGRIRVIRLVVPNILGFSEIDLLYNRYHKEEVVIYPSLSEVKGLNLLDPRSNGDHQAKHSIYEEPLLQYGTRAYDRGDPFNRIHWKATAKRNELQTKIVEKVNQLSWCFIINVKTEYGTSMVEQTEQLLEQTAYMCRFATERQIPFEIYMNVRGRGGAPYVHLTLGEGHHHLMNALELLARVNPLGLTAPLLHTLNHLNQQPKPPYIIQIGEMSQQHHPFFKRWEQNGHSVIT
ncbi:DUF58 domain-containing protein [Piscibacillus salipiscarius]|uniref:DUF58 domain-containing protein n=1 Tax=Piscibacillus salipiscarius TaxID=299480 RepID=UPI0006D11A6D|nr:DUF58 domain-containing protein [Piscibacillus salipiscarius]